MSSGQAAWAQEKREEAFDQHIKLLEQLGLKRIAQITTDLNRAMQNFYKTCPALSRTGWNQLDHILALSEKLTRK